MTVLYDYWRSSAAFRVRIVLHLAGIGFKSVSVDLPTGGQHHPDHLARNPQGLVPTLEIDGLTLTQSLAIIDYLNETRRLNLLPQTPAARARVRALAHAVAMDIAPVTNLRVRNHAARLSKGGISADEWQHHYITLGFSALEQMLNHPETGDFCHENRFGLADICLVPHFYNGERVGVDMGQFPIISRICRNIMALPYVIAAHPETLRP